MKKGWPVLTLVVWGRRACLLNPSMGSRRDKERGMARTQTSDEMIFHTCLEHSPQTPTLQSFFFWPSTHPLTSASTSIPNNQPLSICSAPCPVHPGVLLLFISPVNACVLSTLADR